VDNWLYFSVGYYGLVYETPSFGHSPHLVFVFPTFFTIPACIVSPYLENKCDSCNLDGILRSLALSDWVEK